MANLLSGARAEEKSRAVRTDAPAPPRPVTVASPVATSSGIAGTWVSAARGGRGNFAGLSSPTRIVITQTPRDVTVETDTGTENQMQAAVYKLDGSENPAPGPLGWDTRARASLQDGRLVVTMKRSIDGPDGQLTFEIKDIYSVDGTTLTLDRSQGTRAQRLVFTRP